MDDKAYAHAVCACSNVLAVPLLVYVRASGAECACLLSFFLCFGLSCFLLSSFPLSSFFGVFFGVCCI